MRAIPLASSRSISTRPSLTDVASPALSRPWWSVQPYAITSRGFQGTDHGGEVMEFRLDEGQVELQQTVARFCDDRFPLDSVVAREGLPVDRASWGEMAAMGIFGLLDDGPGGTGLGVLEGALLFEQLGSHLAPGPILWTVLGASMV